VAKHTKHSARATGFVCKCACGLRFARKRLFFSITDAYVQRGEVGPADVKPLLERRELGKRLRGALATEPDVAQTAARTLNEGLTHGQG